MNSGEYRYVWQTPDWPQWRYDLAQLAGPLAEVSRAQGLLFGRMADIGFELRARAHLDALTEDVLKSSEIEGEKLNTEAVRSSIARRLGVDVGAAAPKDRHVEGVVEMVLDATTNYTATLTRERLYGWHAALFPTGYSGLVKITVGRWRTDAEGPMQVVSGRIDRPRVHYEAPPAKRLAAEMRAFLRWVNEPSRDPALIKAGLAHLWFVSIHPFDDGNGRVGRAIGDMLLARADGSAQRFYSLSGEIERDRNGYYDHLERAQRGTLDATEWLGWFLSTLDHAVEQAHKTLDAVLAKARFWQRLDGEPVNERQRKLLNRLIDGFQGNLTNKKWAAVAKCSADTALRDITDLLERGILRKLDAGGRSTSYELAEVQGLDLKRAERSGAEIEAEEDAQDLDPGR